MNRFRILLLPLSWLYGVVLWFRNILYKKGVLRSYPTEIKSIAIGNLALGGTGKTPHTSYIIDLLSNHKVAVLSRGYGRITKGTQRVYTYSKADMVGDEPLQLARKHPENTVVVDENRRRGIGYIANKYSETDLVVLDDALQHRQISAGLNILLTTWFKPFYSDYYLPAGNLRDAKIRARDADLVVVTKCPEHPDPKREKNIRNKLGYLGKPVFFSRIVYGEIVPLFKPAKMNVHALRSVLLITGIAHPGIFASAVSKKFKVEAHFQYRDHHQFTSSDLQRFRNFIGSFAPGHLAILTTEKDAMRLLQFADDAMWTELPIFYWEIGVDFGEGKEEFDLLITQYAGPTY
jgi:tetraacyldisaccharide 4'-kinase